MLARIPGISARQVGEEEEALHFGEMPPEHLRGSTAEDRLQRPEAEEEAHTARARSARASEDAKKGKAMMDKLRDALAWKKRNATDTGQRKVIIGTKGQAPTDVLKSRRPAVTPTDSEKMKTSPTSGDNVAAAALRSVVLRESKETSKRDEDVREDTASVSLHPDPPLRRRPKRDEPAGREGGTEDVEIVPDGDEETEKAQEWESHRKPPQQQGQQHQKPAWQSKQYQQPPPQEYPSGYCSKCTKWKSIRSDDGRCASCLRSRKHQHKCATEGQWWDEGADRWRGQTGGWSTDEQWYGNEGDSWQGNEEEEWPEQVEEWEEWNEDNAGPQDPNMEQQGWSAAVGAADEARDDDEDESWHINAASSRPYRPGQSDAWNARDRAYAQNKRNQSWAKQPRERFPAADEEANWRKLARKAMEVLMSKSEEEINKFLNE